MVTRALLRSLRNDLPMPVTFLHLGDKAPYWKSVDGRFRFQCPHCGETYAVVNPRNNLAHCFNCRKNINNIDLMIAVGYGFQEAVALLQEWLLPYNKEMAGCKTTSRPPAPVERNRTGAEPLGGILRQEFGNHGPKPG